MKKVLLIVILLSLLPLVEATLNEPTWEIGLYWKYKVYYPPSAVSYNLTVKILAKQIIKEENGAYKVWKISEISDDPRIGEKIIYIRTDDFAIVKEINILTKEKKIEKLYSPPTPVIKYGIDVGDEWENKYQIKYGDIKMTINVSMQSVCVSKENITVPAGTYECYKIIQKKVYKYSNMKERSEKQIFYYSPSVGNWVKMESYEGDTKNFEAVLVKTNYGSKKVPLPPYVILLAFAIAILMKIIYKAMRFTDNENSS